jgi:glycogen synthase
MLQVLTHTHTHTHSQGIDLICDNYEWLMSQGCQLVMLGSGRADLEWALRDMENRWAGGRGLEGRAEKKFLPP